MRLFKAKVCWEDQQLLLEGGMEGGSEAWKEGGGSARPAPSVYTHGHAHTRTHKHIATRTHTAVAAAAAAAVLFDSVQPGSASPLNLTAVSNHCIWYTVSSFNMCRTASAFISYHRRTNHPFTLKGETTTSQIFAKINPNNRSFFFGFYFACCVCLAEGGWLKQGQRISTVASGMCARHARPLTRSAEG